MSLERQISSMRREISAETLSMSVSELTNLFREGVLIIRPEFQRLYRWSDDQKSKLIESILLGIPIPSIFVSADDESGKWELVDGLQRISTLLELQGILPGVDGARLPPLRLRETRYLPDMEGKTWDTGLSDAQKLDIRLTRLDIRVIKRGSDREAKYDLFQRLNSFGSKLTAQELRSAMMAGVDSERLAWLQRLAAEPNFVRTVALSDRQVDEQYDLELVLRFLMLHNRQLIGSRGRLGDFPSKLDDWALSLASGEVGDLDALESVFLRTFDALSTNGSDSLFRKWHSGRRRFEGGFSNTAFEAIALGVGYHIANGTPFRTDVQNACRELWERLPFEIGSVTGLATGDRFVKTLTMGRELTARS